MARQTQLHTSIQPGLMAKFKELCKSMPYPISVSMGVKLLIKQSVEQQKLPGMPSNMTNANQRSFKYLMRDIDNDGLSSVPDVQRRVVDDVKRVAGMVIPTPKKMPLYWSTLANLYLQVMMIEVAVDRQALIPYLETKVGHAYWPESTLAYLKLVDNISSSHVFSKTRYNKQTWFDASASLVGKHTVLRKRWKHLMTLIVVMSDQPLANVKPIMKWHIRNYIHQHVGNSLIFNHCTPDLHLGIDKKKSVRRIIGVIQDVVKRAENNLRSEIINGSNSTSRH